MSWKDIVKRDFPSEKYALLVKTMMDRFGKKGLDMLEDARERYDDRPSGNPMTDDEFTTQYIKNTLYSMDNQKDFSIDDEKFAFELKRILGEIWVNWERLLKNDFKEVDSFIQKMKRINLSAQEAFKDFKTEPSVEMKQLAASIIDMGTAIMDLEKMRDRQEKLQ